MKIKILNCGIGIFESQDEAKTIITDADALYINGVQAPIVDCVADISGLIAQGANIVRAEKNGEQIPCEGVVGAGEGFCYPSGGNNREIMIALDAKLAEMEMKINQLQAEADSNKQTGFEI